MLSNSKKLLSNKVLDGKEASNFIIKDVNREISEIIIKNNILPPTLAIILVGNNPASESYVKNKIKACQKAGIDHLLISLNYETNEEEIIKTIESLNEDDSISGFIVQLPLPEHINVNRVVNIISPDKDVDGFHPLNFGKTALGLPSTYQQQQHVYL